MTELAYHHDELVGMANVFPCRRSTPTPPSPPLQISQQLNHPTFICCVLLSLGVDTTAVTLVFFSYLIAKNPEWFDKLAAELSDYTDVDTLQSSELEKLPLLNAVIRETLRLYPPAASPVFSRVSQMTVVSLGGYFIPGGVSSLSNPSCKSVVDMQVKVSRAAMDNLS